MPASVPATPLGVQVAQRSGHAADVVGCDDDSGVRGSDQLGRRSVRRHDRENRTLGCQILEHLAAEHPFPAPTRVGDQEEQRLGVTLQLERAASGSVRDQLEPVAEPLSVRPLAVGRTKVAEEAGDDIVEP